MQAFVAKDNAIRLPGDIIKAVQRCVFGCKILPADKDAVSKVVKNMKKQIERKVRNNEKIFHKLKEKGYDKQCEKIGGTIQTLRDSTWWIDLCSPGEILQKMVDCCRSLTEPLGLNAEWLTKCQMHLENPVVDGKAPKPVDGGEYEKEFEQILRAACENTEFSVHTNIYMANNIPAGVCERHLTTVFVVASIFLVLNVFACVPVGYKAEFDALLIRDSRVVAIVEVKASYVALYHGVMNVYRGLFGSDQVYVWREKRGHKMLAVPSKRELRENSEFITFGDKPHIVGIAFVRQANQSQSIRDYAQASLVSRAFKEGTSFTDLQHESGHEGLYSFPAKLHAHAEARAEQCEHLWMKKQQFKAGEHAVGLDDSGGDVKKFLANMLHRSGFEREPLEDAGVSLLKSVSAHVVIKCAAQTMVKRSTIQSRLEATYASEGSGGTT